MNLLVRIAKLVLPIVACSLLLPHLALAWKPDYIPPPEQLKKMEKRNTKRRAELNTTALLYGKVVDFSGEPVSEAVVTMRLSSVPKSILNNDQRLVSTVTNSEGDFQFEETGFMFYLVSIKREGYQFKMDYIKERSLEFGPKVKALGKGNEPDKPIVFKVRKEETPSFVFSGGWSFAMGDGQFKLLDLYRRQWANPDRLAGHKMNYPDWHADVKASVEEDGDKFRLILETLDPDSGFVIATPEFIEEMTEAPEHGYRPKLILPFNKKEGSHLFAYVKSASGLFYSKLYVGYSHSEGREYVYMRFGYSTNMTGERGLERDDRIYSQYLRDEREGRRGRVMREQLVKGENVAPFSEVTQ